MLPRSIQDGSSDKAASFLQNVLHSDSSNKLTHDISKDFTAEEFTLLKESNKMEIGAEIISVDKNYNEKIQRKRRSTWGVPLDENGVVINVSKVYGGGRNIKPGAPLESDEEKRRKDERIKQALSVYKRAAGLVIDPLVEQECQVIYDRGMDYFKEGRLNTALNEFEQVCGKISMQTRLGGYAALQKAICMDSLGQNDAALPLYKALSRHKEGPVAKYAKLLMFGFDAMDNLKMRNLSYSVSGAYEQYFRKTSGDWNTVYMGEEDDEEGNLRVAVFAAAVMVMPIIVVLGLVVNK